MKSAASSKAGCLIVPPDFENSDQRTVIRAKNPRTAVARAIARLHPRLTPQGLIARPDREAMAVRQHNRSKPSSDEC